MLRISKTAVHPPEIEQEIERLEIQSKTWEPDAQIIFDRIGVKPGWKCLDLGCGPSGVLKALSLMVGDQGQVWGVDSNPFCVQAAGKFVSQNNLCNIKLINGDFFAQPLKPHSFDLVHVRFVFTHAGCDQALLNQMVKLTRPGGYVISQESDWSTWNCYPYSRAWYMLRDALIQMIAINGGDINAGQRNYQMLLNAGLEDVQIRSSILALPLGHPLRFGMTRMARSMRSRLLNYGILKEKEFDELISECDQVLADPFVIVTSYLLSQVWGRVGRILA